MDFRTNEGWSHCLGIALVFFPGILRILRTNIFLEYIDESSVCIAALGPCISRSCATAPASPLLNPDGKGLDVYLQEPKQ